MEKQIILLVDDEPVLLESTAEYLSKEFHVHLASNGAEAWEILNKENIDCLVTDINMPVMNGFEL
ncbi:MAG: response regulator, partial [Proteobacteria bacterium]|nr:response regulator [Pseudomonadota bacterium]